MYARKNNYAILSNDALLRKKSHEKSIEVHGTIYIFDLLIEMNLISKEDANNKLVQWMADNPRVPRKECEQRFQFWGYYLN